MLGYKTKQSGPFNIMIGINSYEHVYPITKNGQVKELTKQDLSQLISDLYMMIDELKTERRNLNS